MELGYCSQRVKMYTYIIVFNVRSTARHAKHMQLDISANALVIRAVQRPKYTV
jgi:hypothetical protein